GLPLGRLDLDAEMRIVEIDDAFHHVFGDATSLRGQPLDMLVSERDSRGAVALAGRLNRYHGEVIDLALTIRVNAVDQFARLRLVKVDDRFVVYVESAEGAGHASRDLAVLRQRWDGVMRRSDEGIVLLDSEGTILQHNVRFFELMRFRTAHGVTLTEDALNGRQLTSLLSRPFAALRDRLAAGEDEFAIEIVIENRTLEVEGRMLRLAAQRGVETLLLVRDLSERQQIAARDAVIQADLEQAALFQRSVLARASNPSGLGIDVTYRPLQGVGGDLYDVAVLDGGTVRLFIADATGHGMTAALSTMLIKTEYDMVKATATPGATLMALNERIFRNHTKLAVMFTAAIVDIAPDHRTLTYSCGAHPAPLVVHADRVIEFEEGGPPLGARGGLKFPEWTSTFDHWQGLVLVTDGFAEARNSRGEMFGDARLHAAIADADARGRPIGTTVLSSLDTYLQTQPLTDDLTLLEVHPRGIRRLTAEATQ
nr:serine/threonine-protein phosphatase [Deltaproteobacteria bacterium]